MERSVPARIPPRHRWCNLCGGIGRNCRDRRRKCLACRGKGYWNADDIRNYHELAPTVCKASCGNVHRDPDFRTQAEIDRDWKKLEKSIRALLRKGVGPGTTVEGDMALRGHRGGSNRSEGTTVRGIRRGAAPLGPRHTWQDDTCTACGVRREGYGGGRTGLTRYHFPNGSVDYRAGACLGVAAKCTCLPGRRIAIGSTYVDHAPGCPAGGTDPQ